MICGQENGCGLELPPGAAHINLEACIVALKACRVCQEPVTFICHPNCLPVEIARRGGKLATGAAERKIMEGISRFFMGDQPKPPKQPRQRPEEPYGPGSGGDWQP